MPVYSQDAFSRRRRSFGILVFGGIVNAGLAEGLLPLAAGAAFAAMFLASLVAAPCLAVVQAKGFAVAGDVGFRKVGVGCNDGNVLVGAGLGRIRYGIDKLRTAVGINGMVAAVVGHQHMFKLVAFGYTDSYAQHDAVAERNDGRFHVVLVVIAFGYGASPFQKARLEILGHEAEVDGDVGYAEPLAVHLGKRQLPAVVVTPVVEADAQCYPFPVFVEHGDGVHAAADDNDRIFHFLVL